MAKKLVLLTDGTAVAVEELVLDRFVGVDADNHVVVADAGFTYALTPCCQATGKGSDSATGVVCRACHREVDPYFGGPATVAIARQAEQENPA
jgi:hypothetical protein